MSINARQFQHLTAMGISLWQQKSRKENNHSSTNNDTSLPVELDKLLELQLFQDIIRALDLSADDISQNSEHYVDLGLFNWQFNQNQTISLINNNLITPALDVISQSPQLKAQLWQAITTNQ